MGCILFICAVEHLLKAEQSPRLPSPAVPENPQWGEGSGEGKNTWVSGHLLGGMQSSQETEVVHRIVCVGARACVRACAHIYVCIHVHTPMVHLLFLQQLPLKNN